MQLNEIICKNYTKQILSETNNPSMITRNKQSIGKHLPNMVNATWIVNGARKPNGARGGPSWTHPFYPPPPPPLPFIQVRIFGCSDL